MNRMMYSRVTTRGRASGLTAHQRGMSLIELMVAMILGLLVSAGVVALFMATNQSNRTQNAMARIQENGRFATGRIEADLRMAGAMNRKTSLANPDSWVLMPAGQGTMLPRTAILIHANNFSWQGNTAATVRPAAWVASEPYPLGAGYFVRGYECSSGTCNPAVPTGTIPAVGTAAGNRVRGTDVITMNYMRGLGWGYTVTSTSPGVTIPTGYSVLLNLDATSGGGTAFQADDYALLSDCSSEPQLIQVGGGGLVIAPKAGSLINAPLFKPGSGGGACDERVFNFTRDFVSVSYWIQLVADPSPAAAGRLIPTLMRAENGVAQEVVQGVERLDFLYGTAVAANNGIAYLDAAQINSAAVSTCSPPPESYKRAGAYAAAGSAWRETNCQWRNLRSIEVRGLYNTVDDMGGTPAEDTAYWYALDGGAGPVIPGATMPVTALPSGRMMRREFMSLVSIRNGNL